jgi:hypothetical protein
MTTTNYTVISIAVDNVWAGSGKLRGGEIVDCGAQFCDDTTESEAVYASIEDAIDAKRDSVEFRGQRITWTITVPDELHEEIIEAVAAADLCSPEQVCDAVLGVANAGGDWKAELAKAIANDAAELANNPVQDDSGNTFPVGGNGGWCN